MILFQAQASAPTLQQVKGDLEQIAAGNTAKLNGQNAMQYFVHASKHNAAAAVVIADKFWNTLVSSYGNKDKAYDNIRAAWNTLRDNPNPEYAKYFRDEIFARRTDIRSFGRFGSSFWDSMDTWFNDASVRANTGGEKGFWGYAADLINPGKWLDAATFPFYNLIYNADQVFREDKKFGLVNPPYGVMYQDVAEAITKPLLYKKDGSPETFFVMPVKAGAELGKFAGSIVGSLFSTLIGQFSEDASQFLFNWCKPGYNEYINARSELFTKNAGNICQDFTPQKLDEVSLKYGAFYLDFVLGLTIFGGTAVNAAKKVGMEAVFERANLQLIKKGMGEGLAKEAAEGKAAAKLASLRTEYKELLKAGKAPKTMEETGKFISSRTGIVVEVPTLGATMKEGAYATGGALKSGWRGLVKVEKKLITKPARELYELIYPSAKTGEKWLGYEALHAEGLLFGKTASRQLSIIEDVIGEIEALEGGAALTKESRYTLNELLKSTKEAGKQLVAEPFKQGAGPLKTIKQWREKLGKAEEWFTKEAERDAADMDKFWTEKISGTAAGKKIDSINKEIAEMNQKLLASTKDTEKHVLKSKLSLLDDQSHKAYKELYKTPEGKLFKKIQAKLSYDETMLAKIGDLGEIEKASRKSVVFNYIAMSYKSVLSGKVPAGAPEWLAKFDKYLAGANLKKSYKKLSEQLEELGPRIEGLEKEISESLDAYCKSRGVNDIGRLSSKEASGYVQSFIKENVAKASTDESAAKIVQAFEEHYGLALQRHGYRVKLGWIMATGIGGIGLGTAAFITMGGAVFNAALLAGEGYLGTVADYYALSKLSAYAAANPALKLAPIIPLSREAVTYSGRSKDVLKSKPTVVFQVAANKTTVKPGEEVTISLTGGNLEDGTNLLISTKNIEDGNPGHEMKAVFANRQATFTIDPRTPKGIYDYQAMVYATGLKLGKTFQITVLDADKAAAPSWGGLGSQITPEQYGALNLYNRIDGFKGTDSTAYKQMTSLVLGSPNPVARLAQADSMFKARKDYSPPADSIIAALGGKIAPKPQANAETGAKQDIIPHAEGQKKEKRTLEEILKSKYQKK